MATIAPQGDAKYNGVVQKLLQEVQKNPVGKIITGAMTKDVQIFPIGEGKRRDNPKMKEDPQSCRAYADAEDHLAEAPKLKLESDPTATSRDRFFTCELDEEARFNTHSSKRVPTGLGSKSMVYFTADNPGCANTGFDDPEIVLFHELVHCLRMGLGIYHCVPTNKPDYSNEEEFLAIVITNIYRRVKLPKAPLRHGHGPGTALWAPLDTSKGFVDDRDNSSVLKWHANWEPFRAIAKLEGINFNPLKEFVAREEAAKKKNTPQSAAGRK
jgi:hypothetical protein